MGFLSKLFGKDDQKKAGELAMTPEQIAKANRDNLLFLKQEFPEKTMAEAMGYANGGMAGLLGAGMPMFEAMIGSAYDNFDRNPAKHTTAALGNHMVENLGGGGAAVGGSGGVDTANDVYEQRIKEIMDARGVTREEAVANQARAVAAGHDLNNDGTVDNNEHGIALGQDLDGDGVRSPEEIAQWRKDNKDHFAAGGTKHGGTLDNLQTTPFGTIKGLDERRAAEAQQAQQPQQPQQAQQAQQPPPVAGVMPMPNMGGQPQNIGQVQGGPGQAQVAPAGPQTNVPPGVGVMPMPNIGGQMPNIGQVQGVMQPRPKEEAGHPVGEYVPNRFMNPRPRGGRR